MQRFVRTILIAAACAVTVTWPLRAQVTEPADSAAIRRIREEALERSQVMELASWMTDVYGPRLTGSPNERSAASWAIGKFREWGLVNPHLEAWGTIGPGWANELAVARAVSPQPFPISMIVGPWTP